MVQTLCLLCCCAMSGQAQAAVTEVAEAGIILRTELDDRPDPILSGVGYCAKDESGVVFETRGIAAHDGGLITFALEGPGAEQAAVTARLERLPRGFSLDWTLRYSGPARAWNPWTSGFLFDFPREVTDARTRPVTQWVKPTGEHPWEVPGDTPYPDTECQLREVFFGDVALVMVSRSYDPDWIYKRNKARTSFARFGLPNETPCERTWRVTFLVMRAADLDPARLAAEAAGRPLSLSITTDRVGNLFEPGEPVQFEGVISNITDEPQAFTLDLQVRDYQGGELLRETITGTLPPLGRREFARSMDPARRGILFLASRLAWDGGEKPTRTTFGILPDRHAAGTLPASPFGMAAIIANPDRYPDHHDMPTVMRLMERIGVRWIRSSWFPLEDDITEADEQRVRERLELLREHGILPHAHLGGGVPKPEDLDAYKQRLAECLERFKWVTPYIEIGNELNHGGTGGAEYVDKMLRPIHEVTRRVFPGCRIMCMGLGGVQKSWLNDFVEAGGMDLIDVLSVHPGCHPRAPEFWEGWRGWVFRPQMLDAVRAAREHGNRDVWITEAYAPTPPGRSGLDLRTSADYLVRTYVCAIALGVKVTEWYQFQDGVWFAQRPRPDDIEYSFGVVYTDLTPKPAYVAYASMTQRLEGAEYRARLDLGADDLYAVRFIKNGQPLDVLWSYREKHETDIPWWPPEDFEDASRKPGEPWVERWREPVTVELPAAGAVILTDIMGNSRELRPVAGRVKLTLTGSPVYARGLGATPELDRFWEEIE